MAKACITCGFIYDPSFEGDKYFCGEDCKQRHEQRVGVHLASNLDH